MKKGDIVVVKASANGVYNITTPGTVWTVCGFDFDMVKIWRESGGGPYSILIKYVSVAGFNHYYKCVQEI